MKKLLIFLLILTTTIGKAHACAVCGCGVGGYYLGLLPLYNKHYMGIRYRTNSFKSDQRGDPAYANLFRTKELYETLEVVARFYPTKRVQITAFLPYQFHTQTTSSKTYRVQGLGDGLLFASYNLFNNLADTSYPVVRHSLWGGVGLKAATGAFDGRTHGERGVANPNFSLGSGSWDPLVMLNYQIRRHRTGLAVDLSGRYATENADGYQFGHRATANLSAFVIRQRRGWGYMPNLGIYAETSTQDQRYGYDVAHTGGYQVCAQTGIDIFLGRWTVGGLGQLPFAYHLGQGSQTPELRVLVQVGRAL